VSAAITLLRPASPDFEDAVLELRHSLVEAAQERDADCYAIVHVERVEGAFLAGAAGAPDEVARALRAAARVGMTFAYVEGAGEISAADLAA
jgi:hypothetical protein